MKNFKNENRSACNGGQGPKSTDKANARSCHLITMGVRTASANNNTAAIERLRHHFHPPTGEIFLTRSYGTRLFDTVERILICLLYAPLLSYHILYDRILILYSTL